jgi:serine phosphatase RsbU (regulator of sigma subunit)
MVSSQPASHHEGMQGPARYRTARFSLENNRPEVSRAFDALGMSRLPVATNVVFDAAYIPTTAGVGVGGDWFGAFERGDGTYVLSIGDVEGNGVKAAAPMANIRAALFALERICVHSVTALDYLEAFIDCMHPTLFATAFQARYDPIKHSLLYANAGHPAPFICRADGSIERLPGVDVPLGAGFARGRALYAAHLRVGDVLVAFTDGLSEMTHDIEEGESRIAQALCDPGFATAARPARWLRRALISRHPDDDVAILTMRVVR